MITGGISFGAGITTEEIQETKNDILTRIETEREEIKRKIEENEKLIEELLDKNIKLTSQGSFFSKPQWQSNFGSIISDYIKSDSHNKNYVYSNRKKTENDLMRDQYSTSNGNKKGTGWISDDNNWHANTVVYDNTSQLIIIPTLKVPTIEEPKEVTVDFKIPKIPDTSKITVVKIATINPPSVTVGSFVPGTPTTSSVNIPNISVDVKDQNVAPLVPTVEVVAPKLEFPEISIKTPNIAVATITIPKFDPQIPEKLNAPSIKLPEWQPTLRNEIGYLGNGNYSGDAAQRYNAFYRHPVKGYGNAGIHNLFDNHPAFTGGSHSNKETALFEMIVPKDGTFVAITGDISSTGKIVTLKDKDGNTISTVGGQPLSGWNTELSKLFTGHGDPYTGFKEVGAAGTAFQGFFTINPNEAYNQQHNAVFKAISTPSWEWDEMDVVFEAENITVHVGSENNDDGTIFIDAFHYAPSRKTLSVKNSEINLYGKTLFLGGFTAPRSINFDLEGTKINLLGDSNTLFYLRDKPSSSNNSVNTSVKGKIDIQLTENIVINSSKNTVLAIDTFEWKNAANNVALGLENTRTKVGATHFYSPYHTPVIFENTGNLSLYGSQNIVGKFSLAFLKTDPLQENKIVSDVVIGGDQNVGFWFASDSENKGPNFNGIFNGDLDLKFSFGEQLQEDSTQSVQNNKGNITLKPDGTAGDDTKTENSIGIILDSGQREELNTKLLYPATGIFTIQGKTLQAGVDGLFNSSGNVLDHAKINNVKLDKYEVTFGKYSKDNIGILARNGSVVDWTGNVADNAPEVSGTDENSTAQGTTLVYAEGIFWNSRQRGLKEDYILNGINYKELSQQGGKYYIPEFRTTVNITGNSTINSINSKIFFAKDGGLINTKNIEVNGFGTTVAVAFAEKDKADRKTGTEDIRDNNLAGGSTDQDISYNGRPITGGGATNGKIDWDSDDAYWGPDIYDANGNLLTHSSVLPKTEIVIDGNITANVQGPRRDNNGNIMATGELVNDNIGAMAVVDNGTNGALVKVKGDVSISGLAGYAQGTGAIVEINGTNSVIKTGKYGAFVADKGGKIEFGGGTIEHKETFTGSHNSSSIFYADNGGSINFKGDTEINVYNGYPFVGNKEDYSATDTLVGSETGKYLNMNNVTINLRNDGIILGSKENAMIDWVSTTTDAYLTNLKNDYKLKGLNDNGHKWLSLISRSELTIKSPTTINLDSNTDAFNNMVLERSKLILENGATLTSNDGKGLAMGSSNEANLSNGGNGNQETGFTIDGKINILGGTTSKQAIATYTSYGHIKVGATGEITVDNGIGAYGVNGSKVENNGKIFVTGSGTAIAGIATVDPTKPEDYGTDAGEVGHLLDIINTGEITVGDSSVGIYAEKNVNSSNSSNSAIVSNSGKIITGDKSAGIMIKGTNGVTAANGVTANISGADIEVGKESIGIHTENSNVTLTTNYGIQLKDGSVGVYSKESVLTGTILNVDYRGSTTGTGIGVLYDESGSTTNSLDIVVKNNGNTTGALSALYYKNGTGILTNTGNITLDSGNNYGILSENSPVKNQGTITLAEGSTGIYSKDPAFNLGGTQKIETAANNIVMDDKSIGVSMETTTNLDKNGVNKKDVLEVTGGALQVIGNNSTGVLVVNKTGNSLDSTVDIASGITLASSANDSERKIGIVQLGDSTLNIGGTIGVNSNNVGVYIEDSNIAQVLGNIDISANDTNAIGILSKNNGSTKLSNPLNISGNSKNIGVYVDSDGSLNRKIEDVGAIGVTTTSMADGDNNIGIYVKGNNIDASVQSNSIWTIGANSIGMYFEGDTETRLSGGNLSMSLKSDASGRTGIGAYFKDGVYADSTMVIKVESDGSATDSTTNAIIKPVGIYYASGSEKNESKIEIVDNTTTPTPTKSVIGLYGNQLNNFSNSGDIEIKSGAESIGAYFKDSTITNSGKLTITAGDKNIGAFVLNGSLEMTGNIDVLAKDSIGIIAKGNTATITNKNNNMKVSGANSVGLSALEGAKITASGDITIQNRASAGIAEGQGSVLAFTGGKIIGTGTALISQNSGKILLSGGEIDLSNSSIGAYTDSGNIEFSAGKIKVGTQSVGIYAKNGGNINITGTSSNISMGDESIAIRVEDGILTGNNTVAVEYLGLKKGIGIYYKNTGATTNTVEVNHTGTNLINIYSDGTALENQGKQIVQKDGIGIYSNGGALANKSEIKLEGDNTAGIYLDSGATLSELGTISGKDNNSSSNSKVGVYVKNGNITGNATYNFGIGGGIGIYLDNSTINYSGTINISGNSTVNNRTIGIYLSPSIIGPINTNLNVTGKDAIGLYLAKDTSSPPAGANITYNGKLNLVSESNKEKLGVGVYLEEGATLTLGSSGEINIAGENNVGLYIKKGATFNGTAGTISNTKDGIFAYLEEGTINFNVGSTLNIDYANIISKKGVITNDITLKVGTIGLQGTNGSVVTNSTTGVLNGSVTGANGMVGSDLGTSILNAGTINLTGDKSVGLYVNNSANGSSTGTVVVGDSSTAYYAGENSTLNISGTTVIGAESVLLWADGGTITYTGATNLEALEESSIGLLLTKASSINLGGKDIVVGTEGTGILLKDDGDISGVSNLGKLIVGANGMGIYSINHNAININNNIDLIGESAVGIFANSNANITYSAGGMLLSTAKKGKGIISFGTGIISNSGDIKLLGESSIGVYGKTSTSISNTGLIDVGNGNNFAASVGIYAENTGNITNNGTVNFNDYGVGIYSKGSSKVTNNSLITGGIKGSGIYVAGGSVENTGNITLGNSTNGIFVKNGVDIKNTGNISVGDKNSSGIYATGNTNISHNSGNITTGNNSVGIAADAGNIVVQAGAGITAGKESTHIYVGSGTATNNTNMILDDFSVGMYSITGTAINNGVITLGNSDKNATPMKISIGLVTESGRIENNGTITALYNNGIGMVVNKGGIGINHLGATIDVIGTEAYGIQGMNSATIENHGTINVDGINSKGIVAIEKTTVTNTGAINVNGSGAQGVYVESGSIVNNTGTINVNGIGKTGVYIGAGGKILNTGTINLSGGGSTVIEGSGSIKNVGDIVINGPTASIDGVTIDNVGTITIPGVLDFDTVKISGSGLNEHIGTINAETFKKGEFLILSDVTQGNNKNMYVVQYLGTQNVPNSGDISAISQSVSFVADIQRDPTDASKYNIVLVKIPYKKMLSQTEAENFGIGLDDLYTIAQGKELEIFDLLDKISDKDELIATFENELRGNEYANIQDRMLDIEDVFANSYNKLKHDELYTKESLKIGAIMRRSEAKYSSSSINDYDINVVGAMAVKESDHLTYGRKSNIHLGFAQSKFDFTDRDSLEKVYSLNIGTGYEDYINDQNSLKWYLDGDILINYHEMDRKLNISGSQYSNEGKYWSGTAMIKNKVRYELLDNNEKINIGLFGTFNLGYGKFEKFKEKGDGIELALQSNDMYIVRPGVGTDITLNKYTENGKISLKGKLTAEYELGEVYDGANKAKIKNSSAQYYSLEKPKKMKEIINVGAEVKYETREGHAVSFEISREEGRRDSMKYGINLMYRF
ncbi:hypothetical protein F350042L8_33930 [Fusobacterium ulcerans]